MSEDYVDYWGLRRHPFLLAPDEKMMYVAGQYYECLERLKYAIYTNKGGALMVSEDAGLGKTTILLKLIDDMRGKYGDSFKWAFIDHPTLTIPQLISCVYKSISGHEPYEDKLKNLVMLKDALLDVKQQGGKSIIIVDEGQMLCGCRDVLQELRALINFTDNNEYLYTFILSGQKPLWDEIKGIPEFWQRLPVRYYFEPLRLGETRELVTYRLIKAGLDARRQIFTDDAFDIIQRYSKGCPRTILAMADLSLLVGYTDHSVKIGFKEMSKVISAMSGKGESLPYVAEEKGIKKGLIRDRHEEPGSNDETPTKQVYRSSDDLMTRSREQRRGYLKKVFRIVLAVTFLVIIVGAAFGYYFAFMDRKAISTLAVNKQTLKEENENVKHETPDKFAVINKSAANIRNTPDIRSERVGMIFEGETIRIIDEKMDADGQRWYKFRLYGDRDGWISEEVAKVK
jgi:type II secretory pathway predicted ATPase ExeA